MSSWAHAVELTDLGEGLAYLRVRSLVEAVKPVNGDQALILDLRRTTATPTDLELFSQALARRPTGPRLLALISPETPGTVTRSLRGHALTLGVEGVQSAPDVSIDQTIDADRSAYDAYVSGTGLDQLISGKIEKERFDEATLVQEFNQGNHEARPPLMDQSARTTPTANPPPVPLIDRVLQRAVHLHRTLVALNRKPNRS